jgi:hypothetical protein
VDEKANSDPVKPRTHGGLRELSPFTVPAQKIGTKTIYEKFLDKNPQLKANYYASLAKATDPNSEPYNESDIATVDDLLEYTIFELTRTKNEGCLRGKTFTDYNKAMQEVMALKVAIDNSTKITAAYQEAIRNNKEEVDAFYMAICEVVVQKIKDDTERKEFIESLKKLYDEYYIQQKLIAEQLRLQPPEKPGEQKAQPSEPSG